MSYNVPTIVLSRFIFKRKQKRPDGSLKRHAFQPKNNHDGISTNDKQELSHEQNCDYGHVHVDNPGIPSRSRHIGYGEMPIHHIKDANYTLCLDEHLPDFPPKHVSIYINDELEQQDFDLAVEELGNFCDFKPCE